LVLADAVCRAKGWALSQARFYTGIPDPTDNPFWHHVWSAKLAVMGRQGVVVFSRSLRYRNQKVRLPDRSEFTFSVGEEKGVDIRMALDVIRMAHRGDYDVAVIVSQDQDFSEVAEEIRVIAQERSRWIKVASGSGLTATRIRFSRPYRRKRLSRKSDNPKPRTRQKTRTRRRALLLTLCMAFEEMVVAEGTGFPLLPAPIQSAQALC